MRSRLPGFTRYSLAVAAGALIAAALAARAWPSDLSGHPLRLWLLAGLVVVGELLPIRMPRGAHVEEVTISSAFAVAFLMIFGALPAIAVYAGGCLLLDLVNRTAPPKTLFNAAQSALSLSIAALLLSVAADHPPASLAGRGALAVFGATVAFFVVDNLVATLGIVVLSGSRLGDYLRREGTFLLWTSGTLVAFAPLVVAGAERSAWLVPLLFCPTLAIYFGGRHAVRSAHRALHDELTGLANRSRLYQELDERLVDASDTTVLLLDIADFRAVNDTLGHRHGDVLLVQVAERLESALAPEAELVARVGGDEFAIVAPTGDDGGDAGAVAKRIADALGAPFDIGGFALEVRATIGIARYPDHGASARELLQRADIALDRAKREHTLYDVYQPEHDEFSIDRLLLAGQLRRGIESGQLLVHYQPKVALPGGRPHAVEALVRWRHPELGVLAPHAFVPLAEQTALIGRLTDAVLDQAVRQCATWREEGLELVVAVNVAPRELLDETLPGRIEATLERWAVPGASLQIEITESGVVADVERARAVLERLDRLGVGCAIDDFGTGYSSLTQLQRLRVDEIKIDRSFVAEMESSRDDEAIVRSTIELGHNLGLAVTAEGVQSETLLRRLAELGCDYAQGYFVGHPMSGAECGRAIRMAAAHA